MPDFSAALLLLKKPFDDLYEKATDELKEKLAILKTHSKVKNLHKRLWESQRVKTIWNIDRPLSLSTFFYPVHIIRMDNEHKLQVRLTSLDNLPNNHNIISGTVGQGKSILIRYLLGKEIKSGSRIPVLCELRNVGDQPLEEYLINRFSLLLSIESDVHVFSYFALSGKISFLFDGFDEIDQANVQKLMQEIEDLSYKYNDCRILVTTRPDSECKYLSSFHTNEIAPLPIDDLEPFYKKVTRDPEFTNRLVAALKTSPLRIRELVNTPLLATLLGISYRTAQKIPLDFAEFYDDLFQTLLVRHDGSKLGWRRNRKTKLNDREIQQAFEAFCFASRKKQSTSFDKDLAYQLAKESLGDCELKSDSQHFLEDIVKITCLLLEDGKRLNFVHASVQEFFASRYIKTRTEPIAADFYKKLAEGKWEEWQQELIFLQQIDDHRATKYFKLPDLEKMLKVVFRLRKIEDFSEAISSEVVERYLNELYVVKSIVKRDGVNSTRYFIDKSRKTTTFHHSSLDSRIYNNLFGHSRNAFPWTFGFETNPLSLKRSYLEIAKDRGKDFYEMFVTMISNSLKNLIIEYNMMAAKTLVKETPTKFTAI